MCLRSKNMPSVFLAKTIRRKKYVERKIIISNSILGTRSAIKGFGISIALMVMIPSTACFAITTYAVTSFQKVGTSIDPYVCSIILACALIFGSLTSTYLSDRLGRCVMCLISLMGSAFGLAITALYQFLYLNDYDLSSFAFVPVASLCFVMFISAAGIVPLGTVLFVAILPHAHGKFTIKILKFFSAVICSVENLPSKVKCNYFIYKTTFQPK